MGEKRIKGISIEGVERCVVAQVCDVNKPLMSVKKIARHGNRVVFDEDGSYIESNIVVRRKRRPVHTQDLGEE